MVPEVGIEPTWAHGPGDFESPASTSFTTPASEISYRIKKGIVKIEHILYNKVCGAKHAKNTRIH